MKKYSLFLIGIVFCGFLHAQEIDNSFQGYFMSSSKETFYPYFVFDGNGKVDISGWGKGDYFVKNDSLVVFPDKDVFVFTISDDRLIGNSHWVENTEWRLNTDSLAQNNRKDDALAKKNAELLYEYYTKTRGKTGDVSWLFDENAMANYAETIDDLCTKGLARACMEKFGLMLLQDTGGLEATLKKQLKKPELNPEILKLGQKIISLGEVEGHTILGSYYYSLGDKTNAEMEWQKAIDGGSTKAALLRMEIEIAEDEP